MGFKELLDAGKLAAAVEAATAQVKAAPADMRARVTLFELLCFNGDWDRAEKQLDVIGAQSAQEELAVSAYKDVVSAERARAKVFKDGVQPLFPNEPPAWVHLHLEALRAGSAGKSADAAAALEKSEGARKPLAGAADGAKFASFRDGDDVLSPFLEVFTGGSRYTWLPLEMIESVELPAPVKLRDLLWIPAKIKLRSGPKGDGYVPVLYPGSSAHADEAVRLGRATDWMGDAPVRGAGQRTFYVDGADRGVLELRKVEFAAG